MKGILLAGGTGSRLSPITKATSKHLIPIFDKPLVYYPLSVLMLAGIRDVLVIATPAYQPAFQRLLGDGSDFGISIEYAAQERPAGLPDAFLIGRRFLGGGPACLVLGDNLFFGHGLSVTLRLAAELTSGAQVFGYPTATPSAYGVAELDARGSLIGIEEKPLRPKSRYAVTGLYFYDSEVCDKAATLVPSHRGELEITDLNRLYLDEGKLGFTLLGRGISWLDAGTPEAIVQAAQFVQALQERQGLQIACLEEIALKNGWIGEAAIVRAAQELGEGSYGRYLRTLVNAPAN